MDGLQCGRKKKNFFLFFFFLFLFSWIMKQTRYFGPRAKPDRNWLFLSFFVRLTNFILSFLFPLLCFRVGPFGVVPLLLLTTTSYAVALTNNDYVYASWIYCFSCRVVGDIIREIHSRRLLWKLENSNKFWHDSGICRLFCRWCNDGNEVV